MVFGFDGETAITILHKLYREFEIWPLEYDADDIIKFCQLQTMMHM